MESESPSTAGSDDEFSDLEDHLEEEEEEYVERLEVYTLCVCVCVCLCLCSHASE